MDGSGVQAILTRTDDLANAAAGALLGQEGNGLFTLYHREYEALRATGRVAGGTRV